eukprot:TRINITY_DN8110_c0_g1_i2.p2 TRINITY_DN8110_c0_g1~~TRINITY_DN8110_c0_g1_i2.p2  ORF type:complete len:110 (+),score=1.91 TRINITY_DN8110_c0_g1_i2:373-702(+)
MMNEHREQLSHLSKPLPKLSDSPTHIVPDVEHTILFPLSVATYMYTARQYIDLTRQSNHKGLFTPKALQLCIGILLSCIPVIVAKEELSALMTGLTIMTLTVAVSMMSK